MEEEQTIIIQVIFKLEDGRLYNFDVDQTITFYETKKILSNAAHILKNSFTLFHNGQEYSNLYNEQPLVKIFPSLKKIEFNLKMKMNKEEQDENEHEQISVKYNIKEPCREHMGKFLVLYCISCKKSICNECFSISHNNHEVEEKADFLMPAKVLMERIFSNSFIFKSDPKFSNYMSCISFRSIIKTEIFDKMRQLINELESKCINCLEYFSFNEDSTEKNNDLNLELLKKYCTSSFIKLKNNIDTKEILINDEVFLSLYNKLKNIKNFSISYFTENSNKYKMLNQLFIPFTQSINNMSIELNNIITRYINNDIFDKFIDDISKNFVDVLQKEDVNRFMFDNTNITKNSLIKQDDNCIKNSLTPNNNHRILPSILLIKENENDNNARSINSKNNNLFNRISNYNNNYLNNSFKYQQTQEQYLFANQDKFPSVVNENENIHSKMNKNLFSNNNLFNNQSLGINHIANNKVDINIKSAQNNYNSYMHNIFNMNNNDTIYNNINIPNFQNNSNSKSFNMNKSNIKNSENSSNMNFYISKNPINDPNIQNISNSVNKNNSFKIQDSTNYVHMNKSIFSNNIYDMNMSNYMSNNNEQNTINSNDINRRSNFLCDQGSKEFHQRSTSAKVRKEKLKIEKNEKMEIEELVQNPNINSPFIKKSELNNTQAEIEEMKANLIDKGMNASPIPKKTLISVHLSPARTNLNLSNNFIQQNNILEKGTIKNRNETSCQVSTLKNSRKKTNIYDRILNNMLNKEKNNSTSKEKNSLEILKKNNINNSPISSPENSNIIFSSKEKLFSASLENKKTNNSIANISVTFMYPVFKTDIIKTAINKNTVQEKKINFPEFADNEPNITEFPNGGSYCNYENHLFFSGGQEYIKGAGKVFLSISQKQNSFNKKVNKLPLMKYSHWNHSMIGEKGKIYVIGGYNSRKCEVYDINKQKWTEMPDLNEKERQRSMLFVKNNFLYCFMGLTQNGILDTIERINLNNINAGWENIIVHKIEDINLKFYGAGIVNQSNKIYFIGGKKENKKKEIVYKKSIYEFSFDNFEMNITDFKIENDLIFIENKLYSMDENDCGNFINIRNGYLISMFNLFK